MRQEEEIVFTAAKNRIMQHLKYLEDLQLELSKTTTYEERMHLLRYHFADDIKSDAANLADFEQTKFQMLHRLYGIEIELKKLEQTNGDLK